MRSHTLYAFVIFCCFTLSVKSQNCLPEGIRFASQEDIDNFPIHYPGCTIIDGDVGIGNWENGPSDITNLNGLSQLTRIMGTLTIRRNPLLPDLAGLHNLTAFEDDVIITANSQLNSIDALNQIQHIGGNLEISFNESLTNIDGFELVDTVMGEINLRYLWNLSSYTAFPNLRYLGGFSLSGNEELLTLPDMLHLEYLGKFEFYENQKLTDLPSFPLLAEIHGDFRIETNFELKGIFGYENITRIHGSVILGKKGLEQRNETEWDINAFHHLVYVGGIFSIDAGPKLDSLDGFTQLDTIGGGLYLDYHAIKYHNFPQHNRFHLIKRGGANISNSDSLLNLTFLSELDTLTGLGVSNCPNFVNFEGIEHLPQIHGSLLLGSLRLTSLDGLDHLTSIKGNLTLIRMDSLKDLRGLENLTTVNGYVYVYYNDLLESLDGIQNIDGEAIGYALGHDVILEENQLLSECAVKSICEALHVYDKDYKIQRNAVGCNTISQINCIDHGLSGRVFYDENQNKVQDNDERGMQNRLVDVNTGESLAATNKTGEYLIIADEDSSYILALQVPPVWTLTTDSASYTRIFHAGSPDNKNLDFGLFPLMPYTALETNISSDFTRCNTKVNFHLQYANTGTSDADGKVVVIYDEHVTFQQATPAPSLHDAANRQLTWQFDTLDAFEVRNGNIQFNMPDESFEGQYVDFLVEGYIDSSGQEVRKDTFLYSSQIICAIDPNDKMVTPPGIRDEHYTLKEETLTYTVRFENEGSAEAIDITISDTLTAAFDMSTFRVINSSFPVFTMIEDHVVTFFFPNIWLQPMKTGFVTYEIRPYADVPELTMAENTAGIYFDLNDPIITNTTFNTLVDAFCENATLHIDTTICNGYSFMGYTESGHYLDTVPFGLFCDSIFDINLAVETEVILLDTAICEGESFAGYNEAGFYVFDSTNVVTGCIVEIQLMLTVIPISQTPCITGTSDVEGHNTILYPNPAGHQFYIRTAIPLTSIDVWAGDGSRVAAKYSPSGKDLYLVDILQPLATAVYMIRLQQRHNTFFQERMVLGMRP